MPLAGLIDTCFLFCQFGLRYGSKASLLMCLRNPTNLQSLCYVQFQESHFNSTGRPCSGLPHYALFISPWSPKRPVDCDLVMVDPILIF
jgi:hypothetical protein